MPIITKSVDIGTKLRFIENDGDYITEDTTEGRIYVIAGEDEADGIYYYDDSGEKNFAASEYGTGLFEIV